MISTDIYLRRENTDKIIGRASAKTDEDGIFGKDDDLHTTVSIVLQETLTEDDKIFVSMVIQGSHGDSKIESDFTRKIIFTGFQISPEL